jgi:NAD(P)-dependent dehydrogenase (short-subunit alcohol dehydrogenase family)
METLRGKSALVIGASSGVGRATLLALCAHGMRVTGVARTADRLSRIVREAPGEAKAVAADAAEVGVAERLLAESDPDLVVLAMGQQPRMAPIEEQTWESFTAVWNADVRAAFELGQAALRRPLRSGSTVVLMSSGAAIAGSPLSGGYAGAKRMQWLLAGYLQQRSRALGLGIRFVAVLPKQLVVGTAMGEGAAEAYAGQAGISPAAFMEKFGAPLLPEGIAAAIVDIASGTADRDAVAFTVTGRGLEAI